MIESLFKQITGTVKSLLFDGAGVALTSRADGAGQVGLSTELSTTNFVYSSLNSTSAQLAAGATFTGAIETAIYQQALSVLCHSDQPGILTIDQYIDASGIHNIARQVINIVADVGFSDAPVLNGNYFRVTFKNTGLVTTTGLAVDIYQGTIPRPIVQNNPVNDYLVNVQRGRLTGQSNVSLAGYNASVGNTKEMVWPQSGAYTWKTAAAVCTLVSSSTEDDATLGLFGGDGARAVIIYGLDANYLEISEVVYLNGTVSVGTVNSYLRVNGLTVVAAGATGTNVGNITMTHTATIIQYIAAGDGLSQSSFYSVPAGHSVFIFSGYVRSSKTDQAVDLFIRANGVKYRGLAIAIASSDYQLTIRSPYQVAEKSDIWIEAAASAGTIHSTTFLEMIKIKDGY